jgi:hypothetical protein
MYKRLTHLLLAKATRLRDAYTKLLYYTVSFRIRYRDMKYYH